MADEDQLPLARIYENRFTDAELTQKRVLWEVLCKRFFQRYVDPAGSVVDLGAGSCEFINSIVAARRVAVDLNPATKGFADVDVHVLLAASDDLSALGSGSIDVVFTSNFFEHLPTKSVLLATLGECGRVLRPGGRLVVLMPNLRHLGARYWDYLDHHLPLTDRSLAEAMEISGFVVEELIPRFLPYTVLDAPLRVRPTLVAAYLKVPLAWRIFGRQMFAVGRVP